MLLRPFVITVLFMLSGCTAADTGSFAAGLFFGSTTIAMQEEGIDLTPPPVGPNAMGCADEAVISIDANDSIWFEGAILSGPEFKEHLKKINTCVLLRVNQNASHGNLVFIKDTLDQAGVANRVEIFAGD